MPQTPPRLSPGADEPAADRHVRAVLEGGRVLVYVTRKQSRCFSLSLVEAHHLWEELGALGAAAAVADARHVAAVPFISPKGGAR
jgi:hypothetical protein